MSTKTPIDDPRTSLPPTVVILGNDAQLAARPATPVQLALACLAAGYRAVVPASWGDELIAAATIENLEKRALRPAIHCACPHVARRVLAVGGDLSPYLVSLIAPPVAAARYVRQNSPGAVRITYVGRCPAAGDDSIDARLTPEELIAQLAERGIHPSEQPLVFESVIPPDRRRHRSQPGGLPSPESLWNTGDPMTVESISDDDLVSEIAEKVLAATNSLLDVAPSMGCACSGARAGMDPLRARSEVVALEPPRASTPVVDERFATDLELLLPAVARSALDIIAPQPPLRSREEPIEAPTIEIGIPVAEPVTPRRPRFTPPEMESPLAQPPRRRTSGPTNAAPSGPVPVSSDAKGRVLPRAYVARRRSPRGGVPIVSDASSQAANPTVAPRSAAPAPREPQSAAPAAPKDAARVEPPRDAAHGGSLKDTTRGDPSRGADRVERPSDTPPAHLEKAPARSARSGPTLQEVAVASSLREVPPSLVHFAGERTGPAIPIVRSADAELPIAQSVEPMRSSNGSSKTIAAPRFPVIVEQVRRTTERVSGEVRALVNRSPVTSIALALATVVLLGVAIGYAAAQRDRGTPISGEAAGVVGDPRLPAAMSPAADDRPLTARRDTASRRPSAAPLRRLAVRRARNGTGSAAAPGAGNRPDARPPDDATTAPPLRADSVVAGSRDSSVARDSSAMRPALPAAAPVVTTARNDSLAAEREALRAEIERRRARLDSIARRAQEITP